MTDIEQRLRVMLAARADQVDDPARADAALDGPRLRRLAEHRTHTRRRTGVRALAAAAVVAALAIGQQVLTGPEHRPQLPPRAPAGNGSTAPSLRPSTHPTPHRPRPSEPRPTSTSEHTPAAPRPFARPSRRPTASHIYVPPPPPHATAPGTPLGATTRPPGA